MRSAGIGVTGPIGTDSTPEEIGVFDTTTEENALFIRAAKIPKHVVSGGHMEFARALDIFAEFGIRKSEIRPCHVHEVAYTADDAAITGVKCTIRIKVAIEVRPLAMSRSISQPK